MMSDTKKYVVTMPNTLGHDLGETIDLTEKQAKKLVNKVRLKDEVDAAASKAGRKSALEKENAELKTKLAAAVEVKAALEQQIEQLKIKMTQHGVR